MGWKNKCKTFFFRDRFYFYFLLVFFQKVAKEAYLLCEAFPVVVINRLICLHCVIFAVALQFLSSGHNNFLIWADKVFGALIYFWAIVAKSLFCQFAKLVFDFDPNCHLFFSALSTWISTFTAFLCCFWLCHANGNINACVFHLPFWPCAHLWLRLLPHLHTPTHCQYLPWTRCEFEVLFVFNLPCDRHQTK